MGGTRFTELVGCSVPVQLAPLGACGTPELTGAVVGAGGHGMFSMMPVRPEIAVRILEAVGAACAGGPFGVSFTPMVLREDVLAAAFERVKLIEFGYSPPDPELVARVHEAGALASWQVPSVEEAVAASEAGCDVVVVQGYEAGSRLRGDVRLLPLLAAAVEELEVPVVAAGGIATTATAAAAFNAGAAAVRAGTRFLATPESGAHPRYVEEIVAARTEDAIVTDAFEKGMKGVGKLQSRVLRSSLEACEAFEGDVLGEMRVGPQTAKVMRWGGAPPTRNSSGAVEAMPMYAGESAGLISEVKPAAEVVAELAAGAP